MIIFFRSLVFNVVFYIIMIIYMLFLHASFFLPRMYGVRMLQGFGQVQDWLLKWIAGIKTEYRDLDKIPTGPAIVACKHQSLWETLTTLGIVDDPAIILKRELSWIPLFGWLTTQFKMINVDRGKRGAAIKSLVRGARKVVADGRQIIIFPEGTRRTPGAPPDYKAGIQALYSGLNVPVVPVALNAGLYWPRRKFLRHPGTIIMQVLDPIEPGLGREEFLQVLRERIETASDALLEEARINDGLVPPKE